eukprot:g10342.t1
MSKAFLNVNKSNAVRKELELNFTPVDEDLDFDRVKVFKRYVEEREARLSRRPEGNDQYKRIVDLAKNDEGFRRMLQDPWTNIVDRAPKFDTVEVVIIGAGYGGLCAGARLVQQGMEAGNIRLMDSAGDVGGTWYWNRYPGAMCDVESYTYMPLLEELKYIPTEKYAHQPELWKHSKLIAAKYGLYKNSMFHTKCTGITWNERDCKWLIESNRGDKFRANFVIMNFGTLTQPKLPGVPGAEKFKGHKFHTSRWDYDYTGGNSSGGLSRLYDKSVAIIGTGATAVQVIPHLGKDAKRLFVFQRTPSSVDERNNVPTTQSFVQEFMSKPGWQKERMDNFTTLTQTNKPTDIDLINDGWTKIMKNLQQDFLKKRYKMMAAGATREQLKNLNGDMALADMKQMHSVRMRAAKIVKDKATAEALQPWYQQFCKRPCFHDEYLPTFNRPNVKLVHDVGGVDEITEEGVIAKGKEYKVDCIIFATGFETGYNADKLGPQKIGYDIIGRDGQKLSNKWKDGPRTFWSFNTSGFPNLFMQNSPQGTFTTNFVQKLDEEALHAAHMIMRLKAAGYRTFDPTKEAEDAYCKEIYRKSGRGQKFLQQCTPGYYNNEGKMTIGKSFNSLWGQPLKYFKVLKRKREEDSLFQGMRLTR